MSNHLRSNVLGLVAIFIAISGTAWAAGTIGAGELQNNAVHSSHIKPAAIGPSEIQKDAVRSKHIKNGEVSTFDIGNGTVRSMDIKDAEVTGADVLDASLSGDDIADDSLTGADVAYNSLSGDDIASGTVGRVDLAADAKGPAGFATSNPDTGLMCNDFCTVGSIELPAGAYAVFGKIQIEPKQDICIGSSCQTGLLTNCRLLAGADVDAVSLDQSGRPLDFGGSLSMQLAVTLESPGTAEIQCTDFGDADRAAKGSHLKITAIHLGSLINLGL